MKNSHASLLFLPSSGGVYFPCPVELAMRLALTDRMQQKGCHLTVKPSPCSFYSLALAALWLPYKEVQASPLEAERHVETEVR